MFPEESPETVEVNKHDKLSKQQKSLSQPDSQLLGSTDAVYIIEENKTLVKQKRLVTREDVQCSETSAYTDDIRKTGNMLAKQNDQYSVTSADTAEITKIHENGLTNYEQPVLQQSKVGNKTSSKSLTDTNNIIINADALTKRESSIQDYTVIIQNIQESQNFDSREPILSIESNNPVKQSHYLTKSANSLATNIEDIDTKQELLDEKQKTVAEDSNKLNIKLSHDKRHTHSSKNPRKLNICTECGHIIPDRCKECGQVIPPQPKICNECGQVVPNKWKYNKDSDPDHSDGWSCGSNTCRASTSRKLAHNGDCDADSSYCSQCSCRSNTFVINIPEKPCTIADSDTLLHKSKWQSFKNLFDFKKKKRNSKKSIHEPKLTNDEHEDNPEQMF